MSLELGPALDAALAAAREAGDILRRDLHRAEGPRGHIDKAEADLEAERAIRARLLPAGPDWSFLGEETGATEGRHGAPWWLVDPNDGTRDYLLGRRGSAVSIALLADGALRLGVVFAFAYPDDAGDLFAWAEGCGPVRRNGLPVESRPLHELASTDVVLVSSAGDSDPTGNLACVAPARYRTRAQHRPPPGARGRRGGGRGGLDQLPRGVGLRRWARAAARGRSRPRRRAGPGGVLLCHRSEPVGGRLRRAPGGGGGAAPDGGGTRSV